MQTKPKCRPRVQVSVTFTEGQARVVKECLERELPSKKGNGAWRHAYKKLCKALKEASEVESSCPIEGACLGCDEVSEQPQLEGKMTPETWLSDVAEALEKCRREDGAPFRLNKEEIIEAIHELREDRDRLRTALKFYTDLIAPQLQVLAAHAVANMEVMNSAR